MKRAASAGQLDQWDRQQEANLLSAVLDGDTGAGCHFVHRYRKVIEARVRRVFSRYRSDMTEEDIQDMISEVWLSLFEDDMRCLRRFDPSRKIKVATWISLLARNKTIDRLRTSNRRTMGLDDVAEGFEPPSPSPLPSEELDRQERRKLACQALGQLSQNEQRFIRAWYVDEVRPKKLARRFGIAIGTVYSRRFKIQSKLARAIGRLTSSRWTTPRYAYASA
jgi:RNA polymerase sigma-70 factor (ECF subfamily)